MKVESYNEFLKKYSTPNLLSRNSRIQISSTKTKNNEEQLLFGYEIAVSVKRHNELVEDFKKWMNLSHPGNCEMMTTYIKQEKNEDENLAIRSYFVVTPHPTFENLKEYRAKRGDLSLGVIKEWFAICVDYIHFIHDQGLIHRNINHTSCFIDVRGNLKVSQPGVSFDESIDFLDDIDLYIDPSVYDDERFSAKSDVYSIGVLFRSLMSNFIEDGDILDQYQHEDESFIQLVEELCEEEAGDRMDSSELFEKAKELLPGEFDRIQHLKIFEREFLPSPPPPPSQITSNIQYSMPPAPKKKAKKAKKKMMKSKKKKKKKGAIVSFQKVTPLRKRSKMMEAKEEVAMYDEMPMMKSSSSKMDYGGYGGEEEKRKFEEYDDDDDDSMESDDDSDSQSDEEPMEEEEEVKKEGKKMKDFSLEYNQPLQAIEQSTMLPSSSPEHLAGGMPPQKPKPRGAPMMAVRGRGRPRGRRTVHKGAAKAKKEKKRLKERMEMNRMMEDQVNMIGERAERLEYLEENALNLALASSEFKASAKKMSSSPNYLKYLCCCCCWPCFLLSSNKNEFGALDDDMNSIEEEEEEEIEIPSPPQEETSIERPIPPNQIGLEKKKSYAVKKIIGQGGQSSVFLVEKSDSLFTMKRYKTGTLEEFKLEVNALRKFTNEQQKALPFVVEFVEDFGYIDEYGEECRFIIMEYCAKGDLQKLIRRQSRKKKNPFLKLEDILKYIEQLCIGLDNVHKEGFIHHDIKSPNIFLTKTGEVRIGDFGFAIEERNSQSHNGVSGGTLKYMSPEASKGEVGKKYLDVWSMGTLFVELIVSKVHDFKGKTPEETKEMIEKTLWIENAKLKELILRCFEPDTSKRIKSEELKELIKQVIQEKEEKEEENLVVEDITEDNTNKTIDAVGKQEEEKEEQQEE